MVVGMYSGMNDGLTSVLPRQKIWVQYLQSFLNIAYLTLFQLFLDSYAEVQDLTH